MVGLSLTFAALLVTLDYHIIGFFGFRYRFVFTLYVNTIARYRKRFNVFAKRRTLRVLNNLVILRRYFRYLSLLRTCNISKSLIWFTELRTLLSTLSPSFRILAVTCDHYRLLRLPYLRYH